MRFVDASTLEVVSRRDDERPPYAILSHTWGRDEDEVTLQDMQTWFAAVKAGVKASPAHAINQRAGFLKIQHAANLARSDGLDFVWVDTCCIDKTSSAELSEAINSMFSWYKNAKICYAFLSDIPHPSAQCGVDVDFIGRSRWFTRGWTLQELIAPSLVRFYSKEWGLLGIKGSYSRSPQHALAQPEVVDRESFFSMLEKVTGIDKYLLDGSSELDEFGVSARMKWASHRETTRVEDRAYCLMGLFDVNMPLIYGEGNKAFVRLQEAILLATDDHSIFAWRRPKSENEKEFTGLLAESPAYFRRSGHITPIPSGFMSESTPWSITNVGLRVTFALFKLDEVLPQYASNLDYRTLFAAVLDCSPYRPTDPDPQSNCKPAIILMCLGGDQYARVHPTTLLDVPVTERTQHIDLAMYKNIYVKQKPVTLVLPEIYVDDQDLRAQWSLTNVAGPRGSWDERAKVFRCKRIGEGGTLCTFRYSNRRRIDIIVGMQNTTFTRPESARFWCKIVQVNNEHQRQVSTVQPCDSSGLPAAIWSMDISASIIVGEASHRKHNNITLKLNSLRILQECDVSPGCKTSTKMSRPMTSSSEVFTNCHYDLHHAVLPLKSLVHFEDGSPNEVQPGLCPIRVKNVLPEVIDGDLAFFLDEFYVGFLNKSISEMMAGIRSCINHRFKSSVNNDLYNLECLKSEESLLKFISSSWDRDSTWWHNFLTSPMRNPVTGRGFKQENLYATAEPVKAEHRLAGDERILPQNDRHAELNVMHYAAALNYVTALALFIKLDPNHAPFVKAQGALTPLHVACMLGHDRAAEILLTCSAKKWVDVLAEDSDVDHPLSLAISDIRDHRLIRLVRCFKDTILIAHPTCTANWTDHTCNSTGETALHRAAALNNTIALEAIASQLTGSGSEVLEPVDKQGRTPLWHAAAAGSLDALTILLDRGADPNARDFHGLTVLHAACKAPFDPSKMVQALLSHGADPNAYIEIAPQSRYRLPIFVTASFFASLNGCVETLDVLLTPGSVAYGSSMHQGSISPLHIAAANGNLGCVRVLVEAGFDTNATTPYKLLVQLKQNRNDLEAFPRSRLQSWMHDRKVAKIKAAKAMPADAWLEENQVHMKHIPLPHVESALDEIETSRAKNSASSSTTTRNLLSDRLKQRWSMPEKKSKDLSTALQADLQGLPQLRNQHREVPQTIQDIEIHDLGQWKTPLQLAEDGGHLPVMQYLMSRAQS